MKRIVCAAVLLLALAGCGAVETALNALPEGARDAVLQAAGAWNESRWSLQDPVDEFFAAVDAGDAGALRAMFSPAVQAEDDDLDEMIQALLTLWPGPTEDCEMLSPVGASKHLKYGRQTMVNIHNAFPVVAGGVNYYCSFSYVTRDEEAPENVGLKRVVLATEAAKCHPDYYSNSLELGDGLTLVTTPAVEGETRRIGDAPYRFTSYDRTITQAELLEFLAEETRWSAFQERFGPPNAEEIARYYELAPEDGEPRYAILYLAEDREHLSSVVLQNGRDYSALGVLWRRDPS